MNPRDFFGSKMNEDLQFFMDNIKNITQIMYVTEEECFELACYQLKDVSYDQVSIWKVGKGENATPMSWDVFQSTFIDRFFPYKMGEDKVEKLIDLRQDSMSVKEYCLKFTQLAKYAPELFPDSIACMSNIVT